MAEIRASEAVVCVDVVRCAGLLAAVQDAQASHQGGRAALGSAHSAGPNPYVAVSLLPPAAMEANAPPVETTIQTQTFHPTYNFKKLITVPLNEAVVRAIVSEEMGVEVWHRCPRPEGRSPTAVAAQQRDVLLGSASTPLIHLLTKPQGVSGWLILKSQRGQAVGAVQVSVRLNSADGMAIPAGMPPIQAYPRLLDFLEPKVRGVLSVACVGHGFDGQWGQFSVHIEEAILPVPHHGRGKRPAGGPYFLAYKLPGSSNEERTGNALPSSSPSHAPLGAANTWHIKWDHSGTHPMHLDQELARSLLRYPLVVAVFRRDSAQAKRQASGIGNSMLVGRAEVDLSPLLLDRNAGGHRVQRWLNGTFPLVNPSSKHLGNARVKLLVLLDLHKPDNKRAGGARAPAGGRSWEPLSLDVRTPDSPSPELTPDGLNLAPHRRLGRRTPIGGSDATSNGLASGPSEKRVLTLDWTPQRGPSQEPGKSKEHCQLPADLQEEYRTHSPAADDADVGKPFAARGKAPKGQQGSAEGSMASWPFLDNGIFEKQGLGGGAAAGSFQGKSRRKVLRQADNMALKPQGLKSGGDECGGHTGYGKIDSSSSQALQHLRDAIRGPVGGRDGGFVNGSGAGQRHQDRLQGPMLSDDESHATFVGITASDSTASQDLRSGVFIGAGSNSEEYQLKENNKLLASTAVLSPTAKPFEYGGWMSNTANRPSVPTTPCFDALPKSPAAVQRSSSGSMAPSKPAMPLQRIGGRMEGMQPPFQPALAVSPTALRSGQYNPQWKSRNNGQQQWGAVQANQAVESGDSSASIGVADLARAQSGDSRRCLNAGLEAAISDVRSASFVGSGSSASTRSMVDGGRGGRDGQGQQQIALISQTNNDDLVDPGVSEFTGSRAFPQGNRCLHGQLPVRTTTRNVCDNTGMTQLSGLGKMRGSESVSTVGNGPESSLFVDYPPPQLSPKASDPSEAQCRGKMSPVSSTDACKQAEWQPTEPCSSTSPLAGEPTSGPAEEESSKQQAGVDGENCVQNSDGPRSAASPPFIGTPRAVQGTVSHDRLSGAESLEQKHGRVRLSKPPLPATSAERSRHDGAVPDPCQEAQLVTGEAPSELPGADLGNRPLGGNSAVDGIPNRLLTSGQGSGNLGLRFGRNGEALTSFESADSASLLDSGTGTRSGGMSSATYGGHLWSSRAPDVPPEATTAPTAVSVPMLGLNFHQASEPPGRLELIVPLPTPLSLDLLRNTPLQAFKPGPFGSLTPISGGVEQAPWPLASTQPMAGGGLSQVSGPLRIELGTSLPNLANPPSAAESILQHVQATGRNAGRCPAPSLHVPSGGGHRGAIDPISPIAGTGPLFQGGQLGMQPSSLLHQQGPWLGGGPMPGFQGGELGTGGSGVGFQGLVGGQPGGVHFPYPKAPTEGVASRADLKDAFLPGLSKSVPGAGFSSGLLSPTLPGIAHSPNPGCQNVENFHFPTPSAILCPRPAMHIRPQQFSPLHSPLMSGDGEASQYSMMGAQMAEQTAHSPQLGAGGSSNPGWWNSLVSESGEVANVLAGVASGRPMEGASHYQPGGAAGWGGSRVSEAASTQPAMPSRSSPLPYGGSPAGGWLGTGLVGVTERDSYTLRPGSDDPSGRFNWGPAALDVGNCALVAAQAGMGVAMAPGANAHGLRFGQVAGGGVFGDREGTSASRRGNLAAGDGAVGGRRYTGDETAQMARSMASQFRGS